MFHVQPRLILGAGDDFLRWSYEQHEDKKRFSSTTLTGISGISSKKKNNKADPPELLRNIEEGHSKLNAVAMFFLKRSFKHIRYCYFLCTKCNTIIGTEGFMLPIFFIQIIIVVVCWFARLLTDLGFCTI